MKLVVALFLTLLILLAFSEFEKFERVFYLGGYTCPWENVVFNNAARGMLDCILRCKIDAHCSGAFYQEEISTCIGCTSRNVNEFVPALVNQVYYRRSERGGLTCSGSPCYMYQMVTINQTWTQAEANCTSLGGILVKIDSQDEQERIVNFVLPEDTECAWIGGSRSVANGTFLWLDGSLMSDGYNNWYPEEPNTIFPDEDCIEMRNNFYFMWNNEFCERLCYSVCEFN